MYFAKMHPEMVKKVVTLDNLRVPFITSGKFKILSFRSHDPQFKTDPGVVPSNEECEKDGITVSLDNQNSPSAERWCRYRGVVRSSTNGTPFGNGLLHRS